MPPQARLHELFAYNYADGILITKTRRKRQPAGTRAGSVDGNGYRRICVDGTTYAEHRIIWSWVHGQVPPDRLIDHINGDRQDNRITNLRLATSSENNLNRTNITLSASGFRGVYNTGINRYQVHIRRHGIKRYLGTFSTPQEASAAFHKKEKEMNEQNL